MSNANTIRSSYRGGCVNGEYNYTDETPEQIAATLVGEWGGKPEADDRRTLENLVSLRYLLWSDAEVTMIAAAVARTVAS